MILHTLTRTAVDVSLRVGLYPWSKAAQLTRRDGERSSLELAVDQFDASVRQVAGRVLSDDELVEDAARRKAAVQARTTAKDLQESAEQHEAEAERTERQRREQAERVRREAEDRAEERHAEAEKAEAQRKQQATAASRKKKQAVKKTTAKQKEAVEKKARQARLQELEEREEALDAKDEALTAADEAERLRTAAEAKKSSRR